MKFRTMVKAGLVLGFSLSLVGCGTYHHDSHRDSGYGSGCVDASDKVQRKAKKVAKVKKQKIQQVAKAEVVKAQPAMPVTKVISSTYRFGFDKDMLTEDNKAELDRYASFLAQNPNTRVRIEGHTDEKGKPAYNVALGKRRAETVASYLVDQGVPKQSIEVYSYGSQNPVDYGNTTQAHAKNRRVELFFEIDQNEFA